MAQQGVEFSGWSEAIRNRADCNGICLCIVDELPPWHFQHRGIKNGYRYCASNTSVLKSLFYWHNESVNVWSHIVASLCIFVYFLWKWPSISAIQTENNFDQPFLVFTVLFGNILPLLCSAGCHSFYCVNKVMILLLGLTLCKFTIVFRESIKLAGFWIFWE